MISYQTSDGDMLDDLCWRYYGRQSGAVELVLGANPGLADRGPVYPAGIITLPDLAAPTATGPVRLWD